MFAAQYAIGHAITTAYDLIGRKLPEQAIVEEARRASGGDALVYLLGAVVIAPFAEEVFFRGILLPAVSRATGVRTALALQAVLFGLIHVQGAWSTWPLAIPLAVLGWCAGFVYLRTGSLAVPVLLHATFNALNLAALHAG
jgi:membrane protease YdiL (CAAX protease family)